MNVFIENMKKYPNYKWHVAYISSVFIISLFLFVYHREFDSVFFQGAASAWFIYTTFCIDVVKLGLETRKKQLIHAMVGGAFIWMFIESACKLFAKWAVWRFF